MAKTYHSTFYRAQYCMERQAFTGRRVLDRDYLQISDNALLDLGTNVAEQVLLAARAPCDTFRAFYCETYSHVLVLTHVDNTHPKLNPYEICHVKSY